MDKELKAKARLMEQQLQDIKNYIAEMFEQSKALPKDSNKHACEAGFFAGVLSIIQSKVNATLETVNEGVAI